MYPKKNERDIRLEILHKERTVLESEFDKGVKSSKDPRSLYEKLTLINYEIQLLEKIDKFDKLQETKS